MGSDESVASPAHQKPFDPFMYAPITSHRNEASYTTQSISHNHRRRESSALLKVAYHGVWSMHFPSTIGPSARIGHCHVYDESTDIVYIAYGVGAGGRHLNDMWCLNLRTESWKKISKGLLSPRAYPSAVLHCGRMLVFGGACDSVFYGDLHSIDLATGSVLKIATFGDGPSPRTSPMMIGYADQLFLWGGFDGTTQSGVFRVGIGGGEWAHMPGLQAGAPSPVGVGHGDQFFVYNGLAGAGLLEFVPGQCEFRPLACIGAEPSSELSRPALVSVDEHIFLIGGEASSQYMHLFALDVKRLWWFAFHVRPDCDTLSTNDGTVSSVGLFMMPRDHGATVVYSKRTRELVSVLGSRMHEPPPIFKIGIGEALGVVHLRSDMLEMYAATSGE
jgi:hypothetical protein